jgi:hypothetical protein
MQDRIYTSANQAALKGVSAEAKEIETAYTESKRVRSGYTGRQVPDL